MRNLEKLLNKRKTISIFVIACMLFIMIACFTAYNNDLKDRLKEQTQRFLTESGNQDAITLHNKINDTFITMESLAFFAAQYQNLSDENVLSILRAQERTSHFLQLSICLPNGMSYGTKIYSKDVGDREYFKKAMKGEKNISELLISREDGKAGIVLAVPIYRDGKVIGVLRNVFDTERLNQLINAQDFERLGYTEIFQQNGTAILTTSIMPVGTNFFQYLKSVKIENKITPQKIYNDFSNNECGIIQYTNEKQSVYASYHPIEMNGWYLVNVIPTQYVKNQSETILKSTLFLIIQIVLAFFIIIAYFVYLQIKDSKILSENNNKLEALTDNVPGGVFRYSADYLHYLDYISEGCLRLFGMNRETFTATYQNKFDELIYEEDREQALKSIQEQLKKANFAETEYRIRNGVGKLRWVMDRSRLLKDTNGKKWIYSVAIDINDIKESQEELRQSEERYRIVSEQADTAIIEYNVQEHSVFVTHSFNNIFGQGKIYYNFPQNIIENQIVHSEDVPLISLIDEAIKNGKKRGNAELRLKNNDGKYSWYRLQYTTIFDKNSVPVKAIGRLSDINKEMQEKEILQCQAQRDSLTGLYNKNTVKQMIDSYLTQEGNTSKSAFIVMDIDHFKAANDTYGHLFGDAVIIEAAVTLRKLFRSTDVIGRIGGDEFIVFLKNVGVEKAAAKKALKICTAFRKIMMHDQPDYKLTVSIGISMYPKDADNYLSLFEKADEALYQAKQNGRDSYHFYEL